jgi:DNA-binding NtrC family response regulator
VICVLPRKEVPALIDSVERSGADFVVRPFEPEELVLRVRRAVRRARVRGRHEDGTPESRTEPLATGEEQYQIGLSFLRFREAMQRAHDRAARAYLSELLKQADGEVARAARRAGLERESLHRLLKRHEIRAGDFRSNRAGREPVR